MSTVDESISQNISLGYWLRRRRKALDLTQAKLADQVGCAVATIKKIEADERRPSRQMAERLADLLFIPDAERELFLRVARAEVALHRVATPPRFDASVPPSPTVVVIPPPVKKQPHNLPASPNRLVGRRQEIAEIQALLQRTDVCLVTLTGPGGIGKTRLALQVAHEFVAAMLVECWFVDLAPVQEAALVMPTVAQTLGVSASANQSALDRLKPYLQQRQILLLLDNFEHVLDAALQISELLAFAPGLKVLVTSRAVLHLSGEHEFSVPPLPVPARSQLADLAALAHCEAVALLLERAQASGAKLTLTTENAADIADICRQLEGLPLALELAAARCKLFTPKTLVTQLAQRLPILTTGRRDQPQRQQTLRATIDWSYQLLDPKRQILFARLGVFVGGFTLEAAEAVCHEPGAFAVDVVEGIAALLDQSLLRPLDAATGERRFLMLETLREYAREKLIARGKEAALCEQHAAYFLGLAEQAEPLLWSAQQQVWYQRLIVEQSNFRAALHWWRINNQYTQIAQLGAALCWFWLKHGELREEMPRLEWALAEMGRASTTTPATVRAKALYSVATGAAWLGDFARARKLFEECLQIEEEADSWSKLCDVLEDLAEILKWEGDFQRATSLYERSVALSHIHNRPEGVAGSLTGLGDLARLQGDYARASQLLQESLALRKEGGMVSGIVSTQVYLSMVVREFGDFRQAQHLLEESLQLVRELDDKMLMGGVLSELGVVAQLQQEYTQANYYQQRALILLNELGFQIYSALALSRLGNLALSQADLGTAHTYYAESLAVAQQIGSKRILAAGLEGLAAVAAQNAQPAQAAHLLGAADACRQSIGIARPIEERILYAQTITLAQAALGEARFAAACSTGRTAALADVIVAALADCRREA